MRSPDFGLEPIASMTAAGIGTGAATYAAQLARIAEIPEGANPGLLGAQVGPRPDTSAWLMATLMAAAVAERVPSDDNVGPEMHAAFVRQGFVALGDNEALAYEGESVAPIRTMGPVVASSAEFEARAKGLGFAATAAVG